MRHLDSVTCHATHISMPKFGIQFVTTFLYIVHVGGTPSLSLSHSLFCKFFTVFYISNAAQSSYTVAVYTVTFYTQTIHDIHKFIVNTYTLWNCTPQPGSTVAIGHHVRNT